MSNRPEPVKPSLAPGFSPSERERAAHLFWQAFHGKLAPVLAPDDKAIRFLSDALCPTYTIAARGPDGRLLGLAGFKTGNGGLVGGGLRDLAGVYGWGGALWRGLVLSFFARKVRPGSLLMDGIFVAEEARGIGVGSALLEAIKAQARADGLQSVRLDVTDTNPRARALYERHGFVAGQETGIGPLRHLFGFRSRTEMCCDL